MLRRCIADNSNLVQGDKVQYDEGVEYGKKIAVRVIGGSGGAGLTFGSNIDRTTYSGKLGVLLKFEPEKGCGVIKQDDGSDDLFVHKNALCDPEAKLVNGCRIEYNSFWDDEVSGRRAANVVVAGFAVDSALECVNAMEDDYPSNSAKMDVGPNAVTGCIVVPTDEEEGDDDVLDGWTILTD